MKLTEKQLKSIINEVMTEAQDHVIDDMASQLARTFTTGLSPEPESLQQLTQDLYADLLNKPDAFFPVRVEDCEPMAYAAARQAAPMIARHPDFIAFLGDALARAFRQLV
jgi:hypothetical protein